MNELLPHGQCLLWQSSLLWLHGVSDTLITAAYYSIPVTLGYFVYKRRDLAFSWMFLLFGAFIFLCGTTHLIGLWTLWKPVYWFDGLVKLMTAGVSVGTAILLVQLMPAALSLPSPSQMEAKNRELSKEIAERKRAEQMQSRLLEKVMSVPEEERRQLANVLQNEIGQALTGLLVGLTTLGGETSIQEAKRRANELRITTAETLHELRRLALGLRPSLAADLGLEDALRHYISDYGQVHGIAIRMEAAGLEAGRLPGSVETALYRIAQEALRNTAQHASAHLVKIVLRREASEVQMTIEDEGSGFDVDRSLAESAASARMGLWAMKEYARQVNGFLTIVSEPSQGTTIAVRVPLTDETARPTQA